MSDLERAQEWLGCRRGEFVGVLTGKTEAICEMHGLADDWPCSKATGLAALLTETRAEGWDEGFNAATDAVPEDVGFMSWSRIVNPYRGDGS